MVASTKGVTIMGGQGMMSFTDATFEDEVLNSDVPVLVDFTAAWCGPCKQLAPVLEKAAQEYEGRIKIGQVDVDGNRQTATKYLVRSIPTLLLFKDGKVLEQSVGLVNSKKLNAILDKAL
jgi:thioredoxin 1